MHYADKQIPLHKRGRNWTRKGGRSWKRFDILVETLWAFAHGNYFVEDDGEAVTYVEHVPTGIVFERVALEGEPYVLTPRAINAGEPLPATDDYYVIGHAALLRVIEAQQELLRASQDHEAVTTTH
jgi:hypothetical protein